MQNIISLIQLDERSRTETAMDKTPSLSSSAIMTLLCIASLTIMVGAVIAPGLPQIAAALNVAAHPGWLMTLPALGAILFAPLAGRIIDSVGAYRSLTVGLFCYGLLGVMLIWLHSPGWIYTDRLMLGGMTVMVMAATTMLISQWFSGEARLAMIAKQGMAIEIGGVVFLFLGGVFASLHWALPLSIYLFAWLFLVMLRQYVPSHHPAINESDDKTLTALEQAADMPLRLIFFITGLSMLIFFSTVVVLPVTLAADGYSEAEVGYLLAFSSFIAMLSAYCMPLLALRLGETRLLMLAFVFYGAAHCLFWQSNATGLLIMAAIGNGIGFGFSIPLLNHMTVMRSASKARGKNLSYYAMAVFSGQLMTSFVTLLPDYQSRAFMVTTTLACLTGAGLLVYLRQQAR
ncbi:major facilitator superfamily MFS_1 [Methylophaga frappieri]|uniref:Major facilitator superfamily MFS_1 n=1 Tax=Methylophaga frappieri (strain ATCC BAA-2434 / DSM 25690 / JAM7) TaxID=754477 RepID=I1YG81_METFJ|nr:MFS transporter [Methylophaga frappieri]AFJ01924.1 major facilitator superfamily MFS_1 [Methylophaga frappieri]